MSMPVLVMAMWGECHDKKRKEVDKMISRCLKGATVNNLFLLITQNKIHIIPRIDNFKVLFSSGLKILPSKAIGQTPKIPEPGRRNSLLSCWQCCTRDFQNIQPIDISHGYLRAAEGK